jgi:YggT family protein
MLLLAARALLSWFVNPRMGVPNIMLYRLNFLLIRLTEPIVTPCRRFLSGFNTGMLDFSVMAAILAVMLVRRLLIVLIGILL